MENHSPKKYFLCFNTVAKYKTGMRVGPCVVIKLNCAYGTHCCFISQKNRYQTTAV
jgi:hypothetical protein